MAEQKRATLTDVELLVRMIEEELAAEGATGGFVIEAVTPDGKTHLFAGGEPDPDGDDG